MACAQRLSRGTRTHSACFRRYGADKRIIKACIPPSCLPIAFLDVGALLRLALVCWNQVVLPECAWAVLCQGKTLKHVWPHRVQSDDMADITVGAVLGQGGDAIVCVGVLSYPLAITPAV